jgi:hypothetical protein
MLVLVLATLLGWFDGHDGASGGKHTAVVG